MRKRFFYLLLTLLVLIEAAQAWFVLKYLEWFKEHGVEFIYPVLFSISFIALGLLTYFLILGVKSIKNRK
jgi:hypothetical protein